MKVKICGITDKKMLRVAAEAGADYVGFVFYPASVRALTVENAGFLAGQAPSSVKRVGLFVDPDDHLLETVLKRVEMEVIQLHGAESPARVAAIAKKWRRPVIKAIRVAEDSDVARAKDYEGVADWLLFDAKVAGQVGGTGQNFDWSLLKDFKSKRPWMLSGGLHGRNVAEALGLLTPDAVDVSSGVEDAPGVKSAIKIKEFIEEAKRF